MDVLASSADPAVVWLLIFGVLAATSLAVALMVLFMRCRDERPWMAFVCVVAITNAVLLSLYAVGLLDSSNVGLLKPIGALNLLAMAMSFLASADCISRIKRRWEKGFLNVVGSLSLLFLFASVFVGLVASDGKKTLTAQDAEPPMREIQ